LPLTVDFEWCTHESIGAVPVLYHESTNAFSWTATIATASAMSEKRSALTPRAGYIRCSMQRVGLQLWKHLAEDELRGCALLVLANKQARPSAAVGHAYFGAPGARCRTAVARTRTRACAHATGVRIHWHTLTRPNVSYSLRTTSGNHPTNRILTIHARPCAQYLGV
jgi:hypothetical protein